MLSGADPPLSTDLILAAYRQGLFPMASPDGNVGWYTADPRAIFPLETTRPNARLRRFLRNSGFHFTTDQAFGAVIGQCAALHGDTWISQAIQEAYTALHRAGHAHSVETWKDGELVGGIYGVHIGAAFFGESMFRTVANGSKAAFHTLAERLRQRGFTLFDSQFINHHTALLGAVEVPRSEYLALLKDALGRPVEFG